MNEDEAFIRAIVNNPGDDTPRLVYADWLDDHSDPRGPYLRAERETVETGDIARLRELAAGLDPVWVARVSRPPGGACCDRVRFTGERPALGAAELVAIEARLRLTLPAPLRAMLLNYNGGKPEPGGYRARWRKPGDAPDFVDQFYSVRVGGEQPVGRRAPSGDDGLEYATKVLNGGFVSRATDPAVFQQWTAGARHFVALAEPAGGLGVLAVGLTGRRAGKVYAFNRTLVSTSTSPKLLADSLAEFLASVTVE